MSKLCAIVLCAAAAAVALTLFVLGWRCIHVDAGARHTWRGRFLLAVAFFLAVFSGRLGQGLLSAPPPDAGETVPAAGGVEETREWKALTATWKESEEVGSGRRGAYPFDAAGQKKMLVDLKSAGKGADKLAAAGLLTTAEAGLLKKGLAELVTGVQAKRPTELQGATCYLPMMLPRPAEVSARRLTDRLPLLEQLAKGGKVHPAAVEKVLWKIDDDLGVLAKAENLARLGAKERAEAEKTRDAVKAHVDRIRALLKEALKPTGTN